jgi:hypothetical protein
MNPLRSRGRIRTLSLSAVVVGFLLALTPARAEAAGFTIDHAAVGCVVAEQHPVFEARLDPERRGHGMDQTACVVSPGSLDLDQITRIVSPGFQAAGASSWRPSQASSSGPFSVQTA